MVAFESSLPKELVKDLTEVAHLRCQSAAFERILAIAAKRRVQE